jgi:hypothetical protein
MQSVITVVCLFFFIINLKDYTFILCDVADFVNTETRKTAKKDGENKI